MIHPESQGKTIDLSDYDYTQDIEIRKLFATLSAFDITLLEEILYSSLCVDIDELADSIGAERSQVDQTLKKFNDANLFVLAGDTLIIDKERRKSFELIAERMEDSFSPDIRHLIQALSKVPISALPRWYALPHASVEIFETIVDKYLLTPKCYRTQRTEAANQNPLINQILQMFAEANDKPIEAERVMESLAITLDQFHSLAIELEFHFFCCLTYKVTDDQSTLFLSPLNEWVNYLEFEQTVRRQDGPDSDEVTRTHNSDFGFSQDMGKLLRSLLIEGISLKDNGMVEDPSAISQLYANSDLCTPEEYFITLSKTLKKLQLADCSMGKLVITEAGKKWLAEPTQEQAMRLYLYQMRLYYQGAFTPYSDRDAREVEKALKNLPADSWVFVDAFLINNSSAVGSASPVTLKLKGTKWFYELPAHNEADKAFIHHVLMDHLFKCGMVATGKFQNREVFRITPFGRMSIIS